MNKIFSSPIFVCWDVTYRCNLNCLHCCFGDSNNNNNVNKELTTLEAKKLFDELSDLKIISFQFAGGEPMIRKDFFELAEYVCKKNIITTVATNGLYIDKYAAKKMKNIGINGVQISLDGINEEQHEFIRGENTFSRTIEAIQHLINAKIPVSVATLVHKKNVEDLYTLINFLNSIGVKNMRLQFLLLQGNAVDNLGELFVELNKIKEIIDRVYNHSLVRQKKFNLILPCFVPSLIGQKVFNTNKSSFLINNCGAGTCNVNINPFGDVTACGILTDEKWICGNIRENSLKTIWNKSKGFSIWRQVIELKGKCSSCDLLDDCRGGCRASAYLTTGDIKASDPLCWRGVEANETAC
ncbi:radical SAM additional 4Fe4S-binding SPASM domain-containing protein [Marinitoga hydrogenitolerans DSM 16785]|uniref:Radical SAM additional 4Fe4S-binding SPASM domain-containing protein n=1 Tax=Marinitoga hydrogenitolerans (strain DSM 16785 / JCM 12826 / AT1271) TaxID=1122195 RepID=A0A1M5A1F2_MARH1|nr:radical SAM protein [Marinitoga hydrogenitolerans]SHF24123.1 radical SAM additional 4Fe4S-binding SPASM domain-containing protein [Marinitoga hydrogenitolerans DSM 16785]